VFKHSFHTPSIQTDDLLQDRQDSYEDLINYLSAADDLRALSQEGGHVRKSEGPLKVREKRTSAADG
jgi:hypothetical protein